MNVGHYESCGIHHAACPDPEVCILRSRLDAALDIVKTLEHALRWTVGVVDSTHEAPNTTRGHQALRKCEMWREREAK